MATSTSSSARRRQRSSQTLVWRLTAYSGVALLALLTVHMVAHHFVVNTVGGLRTYRQVLEYISDPLIVAVEAAFLLVVTVHAMLGLRGVLFDVVTGARLRAWVSRGLVALGVLTVAYGFVLLGVLASRA